MEETVNALDKAARDAAEEDLGILEIMCIFAQKLFGRAVVSVRLSIT